MIAKVIEIIRIFIIITGMALTSWLFQGNPVQHLHYLGLCLILSLSGLTGIEGIFFSRQSADSLGRQPNRPYQLQSGLNSLSVAIVGLIVWFADWGVYAEITVLLCTLTFITLSAMAHIWEVFALGNRHIKNMMRGVMVIFLWVFCLPLLVQVLKIS